MMEAGLHTHCAAQREFFPGRIKTGEVASSAGSSRESREIGSLPSPMAAELSRGFAIAAAIFSDNFGGGANAHAVCI
jgi:hypothetical protein